LSQRQNVSRVGIVAADYIGMKPTMLVQEGDPVRLGQPLFTDKKTAGVTFTAPAAGRIAGN
jgi:Na+-transporting NADH:ubiquinone oxidoreductase subunit A